MRIVNRTHWRTADLARIVRRVAGDELDARHRRGVVFTVEYTRSTGGSSGIAHGAYRATLRLPKHSPDPIDFAFVVGHECAHLRGLDHGPAMHSSRYSRSSLYGDYRAYYSWAATYELRRKEPKPKPTLGEKRARQLDHLRAKLAAWTRRGKLAATKVRTYRRAISRAERRIAKAAAALPVTTT